MSASTAGLRPIVRWALAATHELGGRLGSPQASESLAELADAVQQGTDHATDLAAARDAYGEATACAAALLHLAGPDLRAPVRTHWLIASVSPLWRDPLRDALGLLGRERDRSGLLPVDLLRQVRAALPTPPANAPDRAPDSMYFLEAFLTANMPAKRRSRGVFLTPREVARFIVSQVDRYLVDEFSVPDGLAGESLESAGRDAATATSAGCCAAGQAIPMRILEPAVGSGVFLCETLAAIHRRWSAGATRVARSRADGRNAWDQYVVQSLLPRICGVELLLSGCVAASIALAVQLARTGFGFSQPARIPVYLGNSLAGPPPAGQLDFGSPLGAAVIADRQFCNTGPFHVILGNPPFSGISQTPHPWSAALLRGRTQDSEAVASYYEVDGEPLGERKLWLQDDYVRFLRLAHWHVERAGCGIIGMITNHGYLDNPTFRGVRWQLLKTFPRVRVLDLHGNRRKGELAAERGRDENVFQIDQGTAIGLFRRPPHAVAASVQHAELWGARSEKLAKMDQASGATSGWSTGEVFTPREPGFRLVPDRSDCWQEYRQGIPLNVLMPAHVTAPVTARDHLVVAFTRDELRARLERFRDLAHSDEQIRNDFFPRPRSRRYPAGDTRGWKLADARRKLAETADWQDHIHPCWYRPFDERFVFWTDWMVDWPRGDVLAGLSAGRAPALIARRQMLPHQPSNFFWVVDLLTLDGLIRSDNRGSESVFPCEIGDSTASSSRTWRANFAEQAISQCIRNTGLAWRGIGSGDLRHEFGADDLLAYLYAVFSSPAYRTRYAEPLCEDFPRIPLPWSRDVMGSLTRIGRELIALHLLRPGAQGDAVEDRQAEPDARMAQRVAPGFPRYRDGCVWTQPGVSLGPVPEEIWQFRVGAHQVCRKWLKDRRGHCLRPIEIACYRRILSAIQRTLEITPAIDRIVDAQGGWEIAFRRGAFQP